MSCLRLSLSLSPPKKAWKTFTSKLQSHLHKLHKSKTIKKKHRSHVTDTSPVSSSAILSHPAKLRRHRREERIFRPSSALHFKRKGRRRFFINRSRALPVYMDMLFKEEVPGASEDHQEEEKKRNEGCAADDMWESLPLASPLMQGIDERAEEFIARFRADMEVQERLARHL